MNVGELFRLLFKGESFIGPPPMVEREGQPALQSFKMPDKVTYAPNMGHFGVYSLLGGLNWYYCRDLFHNDVDYTNAKSRYLYCLGPNGPKQTVDLINWVEDKLNLPKKGRERTHFQICYDWKNKRMPEKMNILQVEPGLFWWDQLPHSLFTCLLRASTSSKNTNPIELMKAYSYLQLTWPCVEAFLDGRTTYVGTTVGGWYAKFNSVNTTPNVVNNLVKI